LRGGDVAVCDKDHIGDRSTWEDGTADKLADEVDATVLIRDCHDDANWNEEYCANSECQDQPIPGKMNWVAARRQKRLKLGSE
jgi:hypothetical protein